MNREQGWNALQFWWTPNSWVKDVKIVNAGKVGRAPTWASALRIRRELRVRHS
jgi:hypothetical protein